MFKILIFITIIFVNSYGENCYLLSKDYYATINRDIAERFFGNENSQNSMIDDKFLDYQKKGIIKVIQKGTTICVKHNSFNNYLLKVSIPNEDTLYWIFENDSDDLVKIK